MLNGKKIFSVHITSLPNIKTASFWIPFKRNNCNPTKKDINGSQKKKHKMLFNIQKEYPATHVRETQTKTTLLYNFLHIMSSQPKAAHLRGLYYLPFPDLSWVWLVSSGPKTPLTQEMVTVSLQTNWSPLYENP